MEVNVFGPSEDVVASETYLFEAIDNYLRTEKFPKNLVIKKLHLLNEKYENKIKELKMVEKKADKSIKVMEKLIDDFRRKNAHRINMLKQKNS